MTQCKISQGIVNAVKNVDMIDLHKRLAHMTKKGINMLSKKNVLSGLTDIHLKKCSYCVAGKHNRVSFKSRPPSPRKHILDLVPSDVFGPMKTKTNGGSLYLLHKSMII